MSKNLLLSSICIVFSLLFFCIKSVFAVNLGTCTGSNSQQGFCTTTAPSGNYVAFYQDKVPATQCGVNATNANAPRTETIYCCTTGKAQYATCGSQGQYVCTTTCSGSNISYTDYTAATQCGINATKAGLPKNTVVYCMCDATKQSCPKPTGTPLIGDVNHDGKVDIVDYSLIMGCFGDKFKTSSCVAGKAADINGDGVVDGIDYNIWFRAFLGIEQNNLQAL